MLDSSVNFAQPDVTLKLDLAGIIRSVALSDRIAAEGTDAWVGRPWSDTVAESASAQVQQMLQDARSVGLSFFHPVRQRFPSGLELSLEYTTVRLGGGGGLIAIGRNLEAVAELRARLVAAQRSLERDYWKLRDVETRYRLLFDAAAQPVLLIRAEDTRILEANPAAIRALGVTSDHELLSEIPAAQRERFRAMLARVREQGKAPGVVMHLGPDRNQWLVRASFIAADPAPVIVLQLSPALATTTPAPRPADLSPAELIARLPEGYTVLDGENTLLRAGAAFLALLGEADGATAIGAPLQGRLHHAGPASFESEPPEVTLVGRQPLREILKAATAAVERRCIEIALERAGGNRTAAAEILGVSRQSLYARLSHYLAESAPRRAAPTSDGASIRVQRSGAPSSEGAPDGEAPVDPAKGRPSGGH